jgi:hypothetical protein
MNQPSTMVTLIRNRAIRLGQKKQILVLHNRRARQDGHHARAFLGQHALLARLIGNAGDPARKPLPKEQAGLGECDRQGQELSPRDDDWYGLTHARETQ